MPLDGQLIGFLGGGVMAESLIGGLIKNGIVKPEKIFVSDPDEERLQLLKEKTGIKTVADNLQLTQSAQLLIIAVKPQVISEVLADIKQNIKAEHSVISFVAGISTDYIESYLGGTPVVRVMTNTACLVSEGASALCGGKYAESKHIDIAKTIFSSVGKVVTVKEELLDAVTGLSGSGPAYMYVILEALIDAGVRVGLPRKVATALTTQTMLGAAKMVLETGEHPGRLKDMVITPGGTTSAGMYALEDGGLRVTLMNAVMAATEQSKQMSKGPK
ncbi:pyrroline-5-carboxylate reductase [Desulfofalx alkaliphila]|uniref:pyrroline-5-carboxylate reductase n=1 Tax=Desulfofalx alkaliphila TaxID=105483 RepID=UPI0004E201B1|nr:pyrroline-5-carboxylate reductase [Desulfofalx alkaliphila]